MLLPLILLLTAVIAVVAVVDAVIVCGFNGC